MMLPAALCTCPTPSITDLTGKSQKSKLRSKEACYGYSLEKVPLFHRCDLMALVEPQPKVSIAVTKKQGCGASGARWGEGIASHLSLLSCPTGKGSTWLLCSDQSSPDSIFMLWEAKQGKSQECSGRKKQQSPP